MSIPLQLQTKANLYAPDVRITDTDLLGYDGDPQLATDANVLGEAALMNAAVSSFYCSRAGNLYLKSAPTTWQALSTSSSGANYYAAVTEVESPTGEDVVVVRNVAQARDPGVTSIITEADTITLTLVWERINTTSLAYSAAVPLINGDPIEVANITTTNDYDKMQFGTFEYTIPADDGATTDIDERDIVVVYGGETFTIQVEKATKPTATFAYALPMLPWDNATEQTSYKEDDVFTIDITTASEALDQYRIIGGVDATSVFDADIQDVLVGVDDTADGQITVSAPAAVTQGTNSFGIQVRATRTQAWSDVFNFTTVECDPRHPVTTVTPTYPANQTALKDNEQVTLAATVARYDEILYTETADAQWDASLIGFTSNPAANTWGLTVTTTTLVGTHRYANTKVGEVRYRSMNGIEETQDVNVRISNSQPQVTGITKQVARAWANPVTVVVTFDQPPMNYVESTITDTLPIVSETASVSEAGPWTITYEVERAGNDTVALRDITLVGLAGPSNVGTPADVVASEAILYNGFSSRTIQIPSGERSGTIPVQVDLTNRRGTWNISWDATENGIILQPVYDTSLEDDLVPDQQIVLAQQPDGTLKYTIIYSDLTSIQTTLRISQNDTI